MMDILEYEAEADRFRDRACAHRRCSCFVYVLVGRVNTPQPSLTAL